MSHKNIGIVHYRIGRTDGVSLEIEKRKQILQRLGHTVKLISGPIQCGADFVIDELEFDSDEVKTIKENSFKYFGKSTLSSAELMARIEDLAKRIEHAFLSYHEDQQFDALAATEVGDSLDNFQGNGSNTESSGDLPLGCRGGIG